MFSPVVEDMLNVAWRAADGMILVAAKPLRPRGEKAVTQTGSKIARLSKDDALRQIIAPPDLVLIEPP